MTGNPTAETGHECLFPSFADSVGYALGQMLLLMNRREDLEGCLRSIQIAAQATILSAELGLEGVREGQLQGMTLAGAALAVVCAWHKDSQDFIALGEPVYVLQEVLEAMGIRYSPPAPDVDT